jgi:hypothetical protein
MPNENDPPQRFLGKRPPANKPTLRVADFLAAPRELPQHPPISTPPATTWTMDRNDQAGTCVVAGMNHTLQTIALNLGLPRVPWTDAAILDLYRTQNPDFYSWDDGGTDRDGGMVIQTFLEECVRRGHILAFAEIDHNDAELMRASSYVGQAIMTGELLRQAHGSQAVWDAAGGGVWGGHCTTTVGYDTDRKQQTCITWGALQPYTDAFAERNMDEAWFVLTADMIKAPGFRNHFDLAGFADAVADLTDGKVVVPVDTPTLDPMVDFPWAEMDIWSHRALGRRGAPAYERTAATSYEAWKARH